jgi:hypothetical protein
MPRLLPAAALGLSGLLPIADPAIGRILSVGPNQPFANPSAAALAAQDGDSVLIRPGEYYDCALWTRNHLVIAGVGQGIVITDSTCQGKALFVVTGRDTTIRDLTLARARVPDGNGAGIRLEGEGLTLERVRFVNDQVALLASGAGAIRISDCHIEGGGTGGERPTFAVLIGAASLLRIEGSSFKGVAGGQISTSAAETELARNQIETGTGESPGPGVLSVGGHLVMEDNLLSIGPNEPHLTAAVVVMGREAPELLRNRLLNTTDRPAVLLLNWTGTEPVLQGNQVAPPDTEHSAGGLWRHRASNLYYGTKDGVRAFAGRVKRGLLALVAQ